MGQGNVTRETIDHVLAYGSLSNLREVLRKVRDQCFPENKPAVSSGASSFASEDKEE